MGLFRKIRKRIRKDPTGARVRRIVERYRNRRDVALGAEAVAGAGLESTLNENVDSELVYESKDSKIINWLPYVFCVFLIGLVGILFWERF